MSKKPIKEMRALSVTQPWAECIVSEGKNIENRSWNTKLRGYIAIHASSSFSRDRFDACAENYGLDFDKDDVPYGVIVGFAKIVDVVTEEDVTKDTRKWFEGDYGFVLDDVIKLKKPVVVKGTLSFWKLKGKTLNSCLSQLSDAQKKKLI